MWVWFATWLLLFRMRPQLFSFCWTKASKNAVEKNVPGPLRPKAPWYWICEGEAFGQISSEVCGDYILWIRMSWTLWLDRFEVIYFLNRCLMFLKCHILYVLWVLKSYGTWYRSMVPFDIIWWNVWNRVSIYRFPTTLFARQARWATALLALTKFRSIIPKHITVNIVINHL